MKKQPTRKKRPKNPPEFFEFSEAMDLIGQRQFPGTWKAGNAEAPFLPLPAAEVCNLIKQMSRWLRQGFTLTADSIEHGLFLSDLEHTPDDNCDPATVAAAKLLPVLQALPKGKQLDDPHYCEWYDAGLRRQAVEKKLFLALRDEAIHAYNYTPEGDRKLIPVSYWRANNNEYMREGSALMLATLAGKKFAIFEGSAIKQYMSKFRQDSASAEEECQRWLENEMRTNPRSTRPKAEYLKEFRKAQKYISERAFDRTWANACKETDSKWDKRRRPRKLLRGN